MPVAAGLAAAAEGLAMGAFGVGAVAALARRVSWAARAAAMAFAVSRREPLWSSPAVIGQESRALVELWPDTNGPIDLITY